MALPDWIDHYPYVKALLQRPGDVLLYAPPEVLDETGGVGLPRSNVTLLYGESTPWLGIDATSRRRRCGHPRGAEAEIACQACLDAES